MRVAPILLLGLSLALPGCDGFSIPGFNAEPPTTLEPEDGYLPEFVDSRPLVAELTNLRIEPTPGGVIVLADGLPPFQEYWQPDLVPAPGEAPAGTLVFDFRLREPVDTALRGPASARTVHAAAYVTTPALAGIRTITVRSASNSLSRRR
jgi:hypothetical protein